MIALYKYLYVVISSFRKCYQNSLKDSEGDSHSHSCIEWLNHKKLSDYYTRICTTNFQAVRFLKHQPKIVHKIHLFRDKADKARDAVVAHLL